MRKKSVVDARRHNRHERHDDNVHDETVKQGKFQRGSGGGIVRRGNVVLADGRNAGTVTEITSGPVEQGMKEVQEGRT